jgi:PIN domain nuclease of toxin-antitoxin system
LKLLLDTHILLWGFVDAKRLTRTETAAIEDPANEVFVSVVGLWEIAIKAGKGLLEAPANLLAQIETNPDLTLLPVRGDHAWRVRILPRLHGDPFDHLIIAQAFCEGLTVMTRDPWIGRYGVPVFNA